MLVSINWPIIPQQHLAPRAWTASLLACGRKPLLTTCCSVLCVCLTAAVPGVNETQAQVAKAGVQNQLSAKLYGACVRLRQGVFERSHNNQADSSQAPHSLQTPGTSHPVTAASNTPRTPHSLSIVSLTHAHLACYLCACQHTHHPAQVSWAWPPTSPSQPVVPPLPPWQPLPATPSWPTPSPGPRARYETLIVHNAQPHVPHSAREPSDLSM
jgi:hypothetical protein